MTYKASLFFEQGKYGWSETWYRQDDTIETALVNTVLLAEKRVLLLGSMGDGAGSPRITAARVSDVSIQRDSLLHVWRGFGLQADWKDDLHGADHPELAVMVRVESGSLYRRTVWLHGMPDLIYKGERYQADGRWLTNYNAWVNRIVQAQWCIRVIDKSGIGPIRIVSFTRPAPGQMVQIALAAPHNFGAHGKIRISGARAGRTGHARDQAINAEWEVIVVDASTVALMGSQNIALPEPYFGGATAKRQSIIYAPVSPEGVKIRDVRTREAGIPFGSPVGRRRPRLLTAL